MLGYGVDSSLSLSLSLPHKHTNAIFFGAMSCSISSISQAPTCTANIVRINTGGHLKARLLSSLVDQTFEELSKFLFALVNFSLEIGLEFSEEILVAHRVHRLLLTVRFLLIFRELWK